jgi:hypothetical protein
MAHLFFCYRIFCEPGKEDKFQMIKNNSEVIVGEEM